MSDPPRTGWTAPDAPPRTGPSRYRAPHTSPIAEPQVSGVSASLVGAAVATLAAAATYAVSPMAMFAAAFVGYTTAESSRVWARPSRWVTAARTISFFCCAFIAWNVSEGLAL